MWSLRRPPLQSGVVGTIGALFGQGTRRKRLLSDHRDIPITPEFPKFATVLGINQRWIKTGRALSFNAFLGFFLTY